MAELILKKSTSHSDILDEGSVLLLKNLFFNNGVKERLEEGGTLPMIDGYLELLNSENVMEAKLTVQVKHLTYPPKDSIAFYDIPNSIFAYANLNKGEVVIFVACDTDNKTFYWRYIDTQAIRDFVALPNKNQQTQRYHFEPYETCKEENLLCTLSSWKKIFDEKMDSFKDERALASDFAEKQKIPFSRISTIFYGLPDSHVVRHEVEDVIKWINITNSDKHGNLCMLHGNAGVGKSVIVKDIIETLDNNGIMTLCIKADSLNMLSADMSLDKLTSHIQYLKSNQQKLVVIVDQIDALSQSLSIDRTKLNLLVSLISKLKEYKDVSIIVSCRKYDLDYDNDLSFLCQNAKFIEVDLLSEEEVKNILCLLKEDLHKELDSNTANLLRTAHLLNLFCMIYKKNHSAVNFRNAHHLYDEFWKMLIDNTPESMNKDDVENTLFFLADNVLQQSTLTPVVFFDKANQTALNYLASNNAINKDGNCYSFFHQSFFDYTLARSCVQKGENYFDQLQDKFQGLEIRSTVKAVLEYDKEHDYGQYVRDLKIILESSQIREHIKMLTLSLIAASNNILECEQKLVATVCKCDSRLLSYFLRGLHNDIWFSVLKPIILPIIDAIDENSKLLYPLVNYLSCASFKYSKEVFDIIFSIKDENAKINITNCILRGHNDYRRTFVRGALLQSKLDLHFFTKGLIDAIQSNKKFALQETSKLLKSYLLNKEKNGNGLNAYVLVEDLCKKLAYEYPTEYLQMFHECFIDIVKQKSKEHYISGFTLSEVFDYNIEGYDLKLLKSYKDLLAKYSNEESMIKPLVNELFLTSNECAVCIAFEIMALNPLLYQDEILNLLKNYDNIDLYLQGDIEYYFLVLLRNWYCVQDEGNKKNYENLILTYRSKLDVLPRRNRDYYNHIYPFMWYNKWKLLSVTIPNEKGISRVKRCRHELYRRYGLYTLKKPDHSISAAEICGGAMSSENFSKLSLKNWRYIFDMDDQWHHGRKPVDLRQNAEQFKKCVSEAPDRFEHFVFDITKDTGINLIYQIAGVKGLLEGNSNVDTTWILAKKFLSTDFIKSNPHDFFEIMKYYFESENNAIDEILPFISSIVICPDEEKQLYNYAPGSDKLESSVNSMLTKVLNSYQGKCLELIIKLCGVDQRREQGYQLLDEIENQISEECRLFVVYNIFNTKYFDKKLSQNTFKLYLKGLHAEALYVSAHTFQYYWYHNPDVVREYIEKIESDVRTHKILTEIYFYGLAIPERKDECSRKLEKIICLNEELIIANIIEVCIKNFNHDDYSTICERFLRRFAVDDRENVIHAYCWHAKDLPISAFDLFVEIYSSFKANKYRDAYNELKFIKNCIIDYPKECFEFIQKQDYKDADSPYFLKEEITKVLLMIYKRLNDDKDEKAMNSLMTTFEDMIFSGMNSIMKELETYN